MKASDLHEAAEERIKEVFRKKRAAVDDGIKVLSSRSVHFSSFKGIYFKDHYKRGCKTEIRVFSTAEKNLVVGNSKLY